MSTTAAPTTPAAAVRVPTAPPGAGPARLARLLRVRPLVAVLAVPAVAVLWEAYKWLGAPEGWSVGETRVLPRTTAMAMPHTWDVVARLLEPVTGATGAEPLGVAVLRAGGSSLGIALTGWVVGVAVGAALAVAMQRVRVVEAAVLPLVVLSQTVPLVALAPLVRTWGSRLEVGTLTWEPWMSVAVIASYLAFFPVAVGMLRGLQSPDTIHVELLRSYGAGWWATLLRLRLPAAVPHLLPALRLAAANAVVGTVVGEVATGLPGGLGRMILESANFAASDPPKPWAPILGAVALGLLAAGLVALLGRALGRYRRTEVAS